MRNHVWKQTIIEAIKLGWEDRSRFCVPRCSAPYRSEQKLLTFAWRVGWELANLRKGPFKGTVVSMDSYRARAKTGKFRRPQADRYLN